jgi:hypothetical protein
MARLDELSPKLRERHIVSLGPCTDDDIYRLESRQELPPNDLPQTPLETIPPHTSSLVLRHDEPHTWMTQKGSDKPDLEVRCPDALPFTCHRAQVVFPRQPVAARECVPVRRRRTWTGAER